MKISKRVASSAMLAVALVVALMLAPSMGANPNVSQTKSEKAMEYVSQKLQRQRNS